MEKRSGPDTLVWTKTYIIILKQDFQASWSTHLLYSKANDFNTNAASECIDYIGTYYCYNIAVTNKLAVPTPGTAAGAVVASTAASTSTFTSPPVTASKTTTGKTLLRRPSVIIHKGRHWYIMSGILKWCPQKFPDPLRLARIQRNISVLFFCLIKQLFNHSLPLCADVIQE